MMRALALLLASGLPAVAETPSEQILSRLIGMCDQLLEDPRGAIPVPEGENDFYLENADGSIITNSFYWDAETGSTDGNRSQGFQRHEVRGGVILDCSIWHAYWEGPHPYDDLVETIERVAANLFEGPVQRLGGQAKDMSLRHERLVWTDGAFPPKLMLEASISRDSVNLYLDRMVPREVGE